MSKQRTIERMGLSLSGFLSVLKETPREWALDGAMLRLRPQPPVANAPENCLCPVSAVFMQLYPDHRPRMTADDADKCGKMLGLEQWVSQSIQDAADYADFDDPLAEDVDRLERLRADLLAACGVGQEALR